jgi:hypothetical protein
MCAKFYSKIVMDECLGDLGIGGKEVLTLDKDTGFEHADSIYLSQASWI